MAIAILSEVKSHREAEMWSNISYMHYEKEMIETYLQHRNTLTDLENELTVAKGEMERR